MTAERFLASPAARRFAALALLFAMLWLVSPLLTGPWTQWSEGREALTRETALAERLSRLDRRRALVGGLAMQPDAPFLTAPDAGTAAGLLSQRLTMAAPAGAFRIDTLNADATDERPGAPVRAGIAFTATQGALYAFLADLETRPPFLRVDDLVLTQRREVDGSLVLSGTLSVSTVPLMRKQP